MKKYRKLIKYFVLSLLTALVIAFYFGNNLFIYFENNEASKSIGTPAKGELINGKRLPNSGSNFIAYSRLGTLLGRNAVHRKVKELIIASYDKISKEYPLYIYEYGETGWVGGGNFYPHKTHQNGLSVDFMVPVKNSANEPEYLPASIFNKFGYGIDFDEKGVYEDLRIDFESMSVHINTLNELAGQFGLKISRVIFYPKLQPFLWETKIGKEIKSKIKFSKNQSWVIHDEHYHIDFELL